MRFRVAFVCTGNRFRSVLAAAAFRSAADGLPVDVESYGTLDLGPAAPLPGAVREALALGLDVSSHSARGLNDADLGDASLVVGFEAQHVVAAVDVAGALVERIFVLPELIDLLDRIEIPRGPDPVAHAREAVARAHAVRREEGLRRSPREIEDPIGLPDAAQRQVAQTVFDGATTLAARLFVSFP
jgi:protein-tyrosine-phosphatase